MPRPPQIPQRRQPPARPAQNQQQSALAKLIQQGLALQQQGKLAQARAIYESVLKANPRHFDSLHLLGVIEAQTGNHQAAVDMIGRAIAINPNEASAYFNRGSALMELQQLEAAVASYDQAIRIEANYVDAHFNRGNALKRLKQLDAAVASYDNAIHFKPDHFQAYYERGLALSDLGQAQAAVASYDNAIRIKPDHADAYNNRGVALRQLKQLELAVASYDAAIRIKPDFVDALSNRGNALGELKQLEAAIASYDMAIRIKPDHAQAHYNRGVALQASKQIDAAMASYDQAMRFNPDHAQACFNKGLVLLMGGDFAHGWPMYEWRWKLPKNLPIRKQFAPDWDGSMLAGSLLVVSEQGVGDEIFYSGMLNDLRSYAASVTVAVDPRLVGLFRRSFSDIAVVPKDTLTLNLGFEAQVYMGSLGRYLRPDGASSSQAARGYLCASAERVKTLRDRLASGNSLVCGVSWSSKNVEAGEKKSLALSDLAPVLKLPDIEFVNLQYGDTDKERDALKASTGCALQCVDEIDNFHDLDGLAALICACDVVVTVSNTTAHLAAALGKPVIVMLPYFAGVFWYWHEGREDSPWYPSARLYRQEHSDDWSDVVQRVKADLSALAGH